MRILVPLPRVDPAGRPVDLAIETARRHGAEILALHVVDVEGIRRSEAGAPPGAIHLARRAEEAIVRREEENGKEALAAVAARCRDAKVPCRTETAAGAPREEIAKAAARCDLLAAASDSRFAYDEEDAPAETVLSLMKDGTIPVLLSAFRPASIGTVVVGCGGGVRTARAVGAMARLGLWRTGSRIVLLAVAGSAEEGEARLAEPRRILADADYAEVEEVVARGPKLETFEAYCERADADAVVLGGLGEHRWDDLVGRSVTGRLIADGRRHLFLYM